MDPYNNLIACIQTISPFHFNEDIYNRIMNQYEAKCNSLVDCPPEACTAPTAKAFWGNKKKDESPMNYASATVIAQDNTESKQRSFLTGQLYDAYETAKMALKRQFGLIDDETPETMPDLVKRIQDGLFVIPEKYKDAKVYGSLGSIRWRDPKKVEDKDGFAAAKVDLKKTFAEAQRIIMILTPAEGLKALQDFEAAQAVK